MSIVDSDRSIPTCEHHHDRAGQRVIAEFFRAIIDLGIGAFWLFLVAVLTLVAEIGFRIGNRTSDTRGSDVSGISTLTGGMMGLLAFTLALAISFAQARYEARRTATVEEASAIGTAWLRASLAGEPGRAIADRLMDYARDRLAYINATSSQDADAALARTGALQADIWERALDVAKSSPTPPIALLVSSLNETFDSALAQQYATESGVPTETSFMLLVGAILATGALGYQVGVARTRNFMLMLLLVFMLSGGMVLVVDFSQPRNGLTRIDATPLVWTIQSMTAVK